MNRFRILYFLLSSVIMAISGCGTSPYAALKRAAPDTACISSLKPEFTTVLYNTSVDVIGNHLSGILLIKKMADGSTRIVFTNEMGLTFFDFEFFKNEFRVLQCIDRLDRKVVLRALRKDLDMIIRSGFDFKSLSKFQYGSESYYAWKDGNETTYLITDADCRLLRVENASKHKKKVIVNLTGSKGGLPDSVYIAHQFFQFNIALKQISRKDAP